jgi:hypothetical protein
VGYANATIEKRGKLKGEMKESAVDASEVLYGTLLIDTLS